MTVPPEDQILEVDFAMVKKTGQGIKAKKPRVPELFCYLNLNL